MALVALLAATACAREEARVLSDGIGRPVALPADVRRIVTLAPDVTEIVSAAGGGERIVGTDSASDFPPAVIGLPKVGELQPSVEAIAALEPDLVIASTSGNPPSLAPALAAAGIPLFVLKTDRVAAVPASLALVAEVLRTDASSAIAAFEHGVSARKRARGKSPRVLILLWPAPLYVAGRGTHLDDLLQIAGADNAVAVEGWPSYSLEALVADPPDIILYPGRAVTGDAIASLADSSPAWGEVAAVREGWVSPVPDDLLLRPGPRLVEGLESINAIFDRWEASR